MDKFREGHKEVQRTTEIGNVRNLPQQLADQTQMKPISMRNRFRSALCRCSGEIFQGEGLGVAHLGFWSESMTGRQTASATVGFPRRMVAAGRRQPPNHRQNFCGR